MSRSVTRFTLTLTTASIALAGIALFTPHASKANEDTPTMKVGTFQPSQVAAELGLREKIQQEMAGLQQRMQTAQQSGDQQAMQAIQGEAQKIQQDMVQTFQETIDNALPGVAQDAGVELIALEVAYAADGVETVDVTESLVSALGVEGSPEASESVPPALELPSGSQ